MNRFLKEISELRRYVRERRIIDTIFIAAIIFLTVHAIAMILSKLRIYESTSVLLLYLSGAVISTVTAIMITFFRNQSFSDLLIDIDAHFKLKDRISTAYEYCQLNRKTEFSDLLINDAGERLASIDKKKIFPFKFSFIHLFIVLLVLINISVFFVEFIEATPEPIMDSKVLDEVSELLKQYSQEKPKLEKSKDREKIKNFQKRVEDISSDLDYKTTNREMLRSSVENILNDIQSEKTTLAQDLSEKIDIENLEGISSARMREIKMMPLFNLEKYESTLNRLFEDEIPEDMADNLALMKEFSDLEELMDEILENLGEKMKGKNNTDRSTRRSDIAESKENENDSRDKSDSSNIGEGDMTDSNSQDTKGKKTASQNRDLGGAKGRNSAEGGSDEDGFFGDGDGVVAGSQRSDGRQKPVSEIETTDKQPKQDKIVSSSGGSQTTLQVLSLTNIGKAEVEREELIRNYQREVESVLKKEDIPLNYREYIRDYFMSINLRKDENVK